MIAISDAFRNELNQSVRRPGHCKITIWMKNNLTYMVIDEYYIQSATVHFSRDVLSRSIPIEECTIVLNDFGHLWDPYNPNAHHDYMIAGCQVKIQFGIETENDTEWCESNGLFYLKSAPVWKNYTATFQCISKIERMTGKFTHFPADATDLNYLMSCINTQAIQDGNAFGEYYADARMENIPVINRARLMDVTQKDAVLAVAFAANSGIRAATSPYSLDVRDFWDTNPERNPAIVLANDMYELPSAETIPKIRREIVQYYRDRTGGSQITAIDASGNVNVSSLSDPLVFKLTDAIVASTFVLSTQTNIASITYDVYKQYLEITSLTRTDNSQPWRIVGTATKADPTTERATFGIDSTNGTDDEQIDSPLLNASNARTVALMRGNYLSRTRTKYQFNYRGDPSIEPYDIIRVELPFVGVQSCFVLESIFKFENGFSGTLTVRKIDNPSNSQLFITSESDEAVSDYAVSDETDSD